MPVKTTRRKRKIKKKGFRIHHLLILLMLLYTATTYLNQMEMKKNLMKEKSQLENDIFNLENEITMLDNEIKESGTLSFVEKVARDEYGLVKPREIIYIDKNKLNENNPFKR
ncbi:MAG: septum formation initiator family protein [Tissierellales bacterium]|nr:septum formation initiator family protein [Tissierellales bacterium]